jgi:glycosyltransferase involved in cell wall biosynthesis
MKTPRSVLFISPVFPSFQGNGLAMRSAATLRMLSGWAAQVHLVVVPVYEGSSRLPQPDIAALCASWQLVSDPGRRKKRKSPLHWMTRWVRCQPPLEWQRCHPAWQDRVTDACGSCEPDLVVVFRFYLWPFLEGVLRRPWTAWLDLDEMESASRARQAELFALNGDRKACARLRREAAAYERLEKTMLPRFERILASSTLEAAKVRTAHAGCQASVLPNTYPIDHPCPGRTPGDSFRLLFIGSFGYYPNRDAFDFFRERILPKVRALADRPVELHIAGSGPSVQDPGDSGIIRHGFVEDLAPLYEACDVVIVPLRAGGGTRIKILEAFSHRRAVVSTSIGMEGLEVRPGTELVTGDAPDDFAAACLRLLKDDAERDRIAENGCRFFRQRHSPEVLEAVIRAL